MTDLGAFLIVGGISIAAAGCIVILIAMRLA
jgi:hypothetical protein